MPIDCARTAGAGLRMARTVFFGASLVLATLAAAPTPPVPPTGTAPTSTPSARRGEPPVPLGSAASYAVLANGSVTGTGESVVQGDLGIYPGTSLAGFPPGAVDGAVRTGGVEAQKAKTDLTAAYQAAVRRRPTASVGPELAGRTLAPGVYRIPENVTINGTLTLDARNDPRAAFVFQLGAALTTSENSRVQVINSPHPPCNVLWAVGNSATLGPGTQFIGRLITANSATVRFASTVAEGGVLSRGGDVRLDSAVVRRPECPAPSRPPTPGTTAPGSRPPTRGSTPPPQGSVPPPPGSVPPPGSIPPDQGRVPPGQGGVPPGQGGVPPGQGRVPPGQGEVPPGR
jgi:hypothetical protein